MGDDAVVEELTAADGDGRNKNCGNSRSVNIRQCLKLADGHHYDHSTISSKKILHSKLFLD